MLTGLMEELVVRAEVVTLGALPVLVGVEVAADWGEAVCTYTNIGIIKSPLTMCVHGIVCTCVCLVFIGQSNEERGQLHVPTK